MSPRTFTSFASDNRIDNNLFENVGAEFRGGIAIVIGYARHTLVTHNQIDHIPYAAMSIGWGGWPDKINQAGQANRSTGNVISANLAHDLMLIGSPDTVAKKLKKIAAEGVFNTFFGEFNFGSLGEEDLLRSIRLFGEHVIPALRAYEPFA